MPRRREVPKRDILPDPKFGETPFVVYHGAAEVDVAALIDHCNINLSNYKVPRYVEFRTELPKSNVGKILRRELRDSAGAVAA